MVLVKNPDGGARMFSLDGVVTEVGVYFNVLGALCTPAVEIVHSRGLFVTYKTFSGNSLYMYTILCLDCSIPQLPVGRRQDRTSILMKFSDSEVPRRGYVGFQGVATELMSTSTPSWPVRARAKAGAPNVVLVLVDDMGFSDVSPYGAEIDTPNLEQLAHEGYRFTDFHCAPACSPTRAALLTGLNPHRAGFGFVANADPGYPAYTMQIPDNVPTIAESFKAGGYATFMVGKWHLTGEARMHDGADKSSWPVQRGFDRYYGCMDGTTSMLQPHRLVADNSPLTIDEFPTHYYVTDDYTDQALGMIRTLRANDSQKPFFLYFAHNAVHGPLQAKPQDILKYRGMYDAGWDHIRDQRFRRQVLDGLFPADTAMFPGADESGPNKIQPWERLSEDQRKIFARYMEVYAAAVDSVDQSLGRLTDYLKEIGEYENTIIAFTSDNGATGEGGPTGTRSYFSQFIHGARVPHDWDRDVERDLDVIGGPRAFVHYPQGWAYACNTPFRLYKGNTFEGGIHVPLILSWPQGLTKAASDTGIRDQYAYVSDLGQTLLELAEVPALTDRHGLPAEEVDGIGFAEILRDAFAPPKRSEQYSELVGNRSYSSGDWKIVTAHRPGTPFSDDEWQLFNTAKDPAETVNVAAIHPDKVRELAQKWHAAAWNNTVFPLNDDGSAFRNRPSTELRLASPVTLYGGTPTLERFRANKLVQLRSFDILVQLNLNTGDEGTLVAHGDQGGGYSAYVEQGDLCLSYNEYGRMIRARAPITERGAVTIKVAFTALADFYWSIDATVNGAPVMRIDSVRQLIGMAPFTGISAGVDRGSPVDWEVYERAGAFPYKGQLINVKYVPGAKAPYDPEVIHDIEREIERLSD